MSEKKYKCPYCDNKYTRNKLIDHVEDKHEDLIPENQTPTQVVFNSINKKDHGTCVVCKKPTTWNEKAGKYNRLCNNPKCREKLREEFKTNAMKKHGKYNFADDPKFQEKMLKGRKISSTYTFTDGGVVDYVGTYELKFLEFVDKVMEIESKDIMAPGPTIEYMYNGQKHYWITDFYYIPANLVLDVKDGGDNPNTRPMKEYREKQYAKEKAIKQMKKYNYLRLTDNNFGQFLEVLVDLKYMNLDIKEKNLITKINEAAINEVFGFGKKKKEEVKLTDNEKDKIAGILQKELFKYVNEYNTSKKRELKQAIDDFIKKYNEELDKNSEEWKELIKFQKNPKLILKKVNLYGEINFYYLNYTKTFIDKNYYKILNILDAIAPIIDKIINNFKQKSDLANLVEYIYNHGQEAESPDIDITLNDKKCKEYLSSINESSALMGAMTPMYAHDANVMITNNLAGERKVALSSLDFNDSLLIDDDEEGIKKISKKEFKEKYTIKEQYLVKKDESYYNLLKAYLNKDDCIYKGIYENLSSFENIISESYINFDTKFRLVEKDKQLEEMTNKLSQVNECIYNLGDIVFIRNDKLDI